MAICYIGLLFRSFLWAVFTNKRTFFRTVSANLFLSSIRVKHPRPLQKVFKMLDFTFWERIEFYTGFSEVEPSFDSFLAKLQRHINNNDGRQTAIKWNEPISKVPSLKNLVFLPQLRLEFRIPYRWHLLLPMVGR